MLVNFGVIKDFKSTEKYTVLKNAIAKDKVSFSSDIRKLTSYSIYSSDITHVNGSKLKAIWTKFKINGEESLVLLDVVKGKYENSKYLNQQLILEQFFQGGKRITQKITSAHFEDSVYRLGHEIEEPLYFFHRKVVKLSYHQEDILHKELHPGFYILSGIAGSGKTSLAYLKLKELYKSGGNCLFTTGNRNLAEYLERLFREEEGDGNVEFLGYKDLVDSYYHSTRSLEKVGFAEFNNYAQGKSEKAGVDPKMLYSLMQYIASKPDIVPGKRDFFKQISEQQFKYCVKLYSRYIQYLEKESKIDLSLSVLGPKGERTFDYIIVDETQDLSPREIENISLLRNSDTGVIVFNVDSNQHSNISLPVKYLKSHEYTKEVIDVLDASFRIPKDISNYAQAIVDVRSFVMQGVPDKDMIREFSSSNDNQGNVVHINFEDTRQLIDTVSIAVIAFDDHDKEEVEQLLPHITQVFTADEIKGLEYETIIVYNPYDKFSEILARHHEISWDKSQVKINLPKDINTVDHDIKILFNQFFTSVTRSKNNLYILEKNPELISNYCFKFKEYLTGNIKEGIVCQDDKITDEEWIHQINVLAINGNISQAVKAYKKREFSIDKIKEENLAILTYEICLVAVLSNVRDLENIPEVHLGYKLYRDILSHKSFKDIPEYLKSIDFCGIAVDMDINNILHVPPKYPEIYRYFLERFDYSLLKAPQHLLTSEICFIAIEEDFQNNFNHIPHKFKHEVYRTVIQERFHDSLENFPEKFINDLLAEIAVWLDSRNLEYLPKKFLKDGVYKSALKPYNNSLEHFPRELIDHGLAKVAVGLKPDNLKCLTDNFLTDDVYRASLEFYDKSLEHFPRDLIVPRLAEIAVKLEPSNLEYWPYNKSLEKFPGYLINQKIAEVAAKLNAYNLFGIYKALRSGLELNLDKIYEATLKSYDKSLENFPGKLINSELLQVAVKLNIDNLRYLSPQQKTYKIYKIVIKAYGKSLEEFLERFPDEELNQYMADAAVSLNAHNLEFIPDEFRTDNLYKAALKPYNNSLENFPMELVDQELAKVAVMLNPYNLEYSPYEKLLDRIPIELITQKIAEVAVELNPYNLKYIYSLDKGLNLREVYKAILKPYNNSLEHFPKELIDHGLAQGAVMLNPYNLEYSPYNRLLENFPKDLVNQKIVEVAVELNPYNLQYIYSLDKGLDLREVYKSVLKPYNNSLEHFPRELIDHGLAEVAIELNVFNLRYLPDDLLTEDVYRSILESYNNSLEDFPVELVDYHLARVAVMVNIENLQYLSDEFDDIYKLALEIYDNSLAQFPEHLMNLRLAKLAIGVDIHNLRHLPTEFLSQEALSNILLGSIIEEVIEFM
jgi:hypothetical protein